MTDIQHIYKSTDKDKGILYAWFSAMHTRIDILLCGESESDLKYITKEIYNRIQSIEKTGNCFNKESELSYVNTIASYKPVKISPELFSLISETIYYNKLTSGYFDVTVNSENHNKESISNIVLQEKDSTIYFKEKGLKINLSGLIKGYALDSIRQILDKSGISDSLINMGNSSVIAIGNHPNGEGWKVGINNATDTSPSKKILLKNQCLTTSGNDTLGRKHILDPHSNKYIEGLAQISVITERATEGEVLSTALFASTQTQHNIILKEFEASVLYN